MSEDTLTNSLTIKLEGLKMQDFDPVPAIELWFNLVPNQRPGTRSSAENLDGNS